MRIKRAIKMKMRAGFSAPYAKSLRMNVISEKKKKNRIIIIIYNIVNMPFHCVIFEFALDKVKTFVVIKVT